MTEVTLGKTGVTVNKNGFGALPIQRISKEDAVKLLRRAYDGGMHFFDTARAYTDSEEKLGAAFSHMRDKVYISSKTMAQNADQFWKDLETSLKMLNTDYIDLYQFHNPAFCPKPGDGTGLYEAMLEEGAGKNPPYRHYQPPSESGGRDPGVWSLRDAAISVLLSCHGAGSEDCGKM